MGRWFGFRPDYEDLPRVWTDAGTMKDFRHLSTVEQEIRRDIESYQGPRTPMDLAVRIRTHPSLRVTSPQKMRYAVQAAVNYGGSRMQTTAFDVHDADWLRHNRAAASALVDRLDGAEPIAIPRAGVDGWADVDASILEDFLSTYRFHRFHEELDSNLLLEWLDRRRDHGDPVKWNVVVLGRGQRLMTVGDEQVDLGTVTLGGRAYNAISRARKRGTHDPADIGALMSPRDRVIDLPDVDGDRPAAEIARERTNRAPGTALLAIYPISKDSVPLSVSTGTRDALDAVDDVIGVGMVLPRPTRDDVDDLTQVEYVSVPLEGDDDLTDDYEARLLAGELDDEGDAEAEIPEEEL
ncbi:MAG: Z1 domain-containing protein, partial [Halobacteriales archaeon]|nr:Z1 domain-containing protein [Halobacteriales archaeon]